jgi:hypothetical protein
VNHLFDRKLILLSEVTSHKHQVRFVNLGPSPASQIEKLVDYVICTSHSIWIQAIR